MRMLASVAVVLVAPLWASIASADEGTKATYLITGLHCPPCTRTVESSLKRQKGIRSAKVDWKTKNAVIEFDESIVPAQKVARLIAATPHMMGGGMRYDGWLALKVGGVADQATAKKATEALSQVPGIARVQVYPKQESVAVKFGADGSVTSAQLIEALAKAGLQAND